MAQAQLNRRHWAAMGESTFVAGIWLLYAVHRLFGRWLFRLLMAPVALVHWASRPALRRDSLQYLQRLHAAEPGVFARAPGLRQSLRHVALFAETMLDKLLAIAGRYPADQVRITAAASEAFLRHQRVGRGGVFVTAHMGCLELCRVMAQHQQTLRLLVLVHTRHAQAFNRILQRLNPQQAVELMEVSDFNPATAVRLREHVDAGGWVAIAGDRVPLNSQQVARVNFLGHEAPLPVGPYVVAGLLRCPLVLLACLHAGPGYEIRFEELAERVELPRGRRAEALQQLAQQYALALQALLRQSPYDWFNFFPFWDQGHA